MRKYWIGVASLDHARLGIEGGFVQLCHGKSKPLKRMRKNDIIIYYSPKTSLSSQKRCQSFTAMRRIMDDNTYSFQMSDTFLPFRRDVEFIKKIQLVSIYNVMYDLDFIEDVKHYGEKFRFGHLDISREDCVRIWNKMKCD